MALVLSVSGGTGGGDGATGRRRGGGAAERERPRGDLSLEPISQISAMPPLRSPPGLRA
jgi:hypothetical protein